MRQATEVYAREFDRIFFGLPVAVREQVVECSDPIVFTAPPLHRSAETPPSARRPGLLNATT